MNGSFGVFCGIDLISGTFSDDESADEHMRELVEVGEYDAHHLEVHEVPDDYEDWRRCIVGLRVSRSMDLGRERWKRTLELFDDSARV